MLDYDKVKEYSAEGNWKRYICDMSLSFNITTILSYLLTLVVCLRRFLPPIPHHPAFGPGWIQVGDAAVLLPLTIICQFHQFPYKVLKKKSI